MERRVDLPNIDLDGCTAAVDARISNWTELGIQLSPRTWVDNESAWPRPLLTERIEVVSPMSLGLQLNRADGAEVEIVVYSGGWADLTSWVPGADVINDYREIDSPEHFAGILDDLVANLGEPGNLP